MTVKGHRPYFPAVLHAIVYRGTEITLSGAVGRRVRVHKSPF